MVSAIYLRVIALSIRSKGQKEITSMLSNHESFVRKTMRSDALILDGDRKPHEPKQLSLSHDYIKTSNHQISFRIVFCI